MRTKEIECWVDPVSADINENFYVTKNEINHRGTNVKARLIIELPERKIELTESEFDEAWNLPLDIDSINDIRIAVKQKLFGKEGV